LHGKDGSFLGPRRSGIFNS